MIADEKLALFAIFDSFGKDRQRELLKWMEFASRVGLVAEGIIPYGSPEDPFSTPGAEKSSDINAPSGP